MNYIAYITVALMLFYIKVKESPSTEIMTAIIKMMNMLQTLFPFLHIFSIFSEKYFKNAQ